MEGEKLFSRRDNKSSPDAAIVAAEESAGRGGSRGALKSLMKFKIELVD